ncbi:hypothetical protein ACET3Z_024592 [Daucus carota]
MQISLSFGQGFAPALATWYGPPDGPGSGGACGFDTDVAQPPFSSMISAGNAKIFLKGHGCVESINGDGDIGAMQLKPANSDWIPMQQSWGATWYANISDSAQGPLSFRITTSSGKSIEADNAVPPNWAARARYVSNVNF